MKMTASVSLTDTVVMISPDQFGFNPETAVTNVFQHKINIEESELQKKAMEEFIGMVSLLKSKGINVIILESRKDVVTPDAVFPNNWFSSHDGGKIVLYPMLAPNRRAERQPEALQKALLQSKIPVLEFIDLTEEEKNGDVLEGTGSLVLDRVNKIAYAMESPRTSQSVFDKWCKKLEYQGIFFHAYDKDNLPIYHTNVVMSIGEEFVVICMDSIKDQLEKRLLIKKFEETGKKLITISLKQVYAFCGNILQLRTIEENKVIVLSKIALDTFTTDQKKLLEKFGELLPVNIQMIEKVEGGSARCMMAEIFS